MSKLSPPKTVDEYIRVLAQLRAEHQNEQAAWYKSCFFAMCYGTHLKEKNERI